MTEPRGSLCVVCRKNVVLIPQGMCVRCKNILKHGSSGDRREYYEAVSWEWEYRESRRRG